MPKYEVRNYTVIEKAALLDEIVEGLKNKDITTIRQIRSKLKVLLKDQKINRTCRSPYCVNIAKKDGLCYRHYYSSL